MSIFKRLFGIGKANIHAAIDKLEDPIKMTEQGLRELKADLTKAMQGLAEVKALTNRTRKEAESLAFQAQEYETKAIQLLQTAQAGHMDPAEADRLAGMALEKKEETTQRLQQTQNQLQTLVSQEQKMESSVNKLKQQIGQWENEAKSLKARAKVSEATKKVNKQLANIDSNDTLAMLERMKDKVEQNEALAQSYGDMADAVTSVDDEINRALKQTNTSTSDALAALKNRVQSGGTTTNSLNAATNSNLDALKQKLNNPDTLKIDNTGQDDKPPLLLE